MYICLLNSLFSHFNKICKALLFKKKNLNSKKKDIIVQKL